MHRKKGFFDAKYFYSPLENFSRLNFSNYKLKRKIVLQPEIYFITKKIFVISKFKIFLAPRNITLL